MEKIGYYFYSPFVDAASLNTNTVQMNNPKIAIFFILYGQLTEPEC